MISQKTANAIYNVVQAANDAGLRLQPKDGTPLCSMVEASYNPVVDMKGVPETMVEESDLTLVMNGSTNEHSIAMDELTEVAVQTVSGMLTHARSVYIPIVKDVLSRVDSELGKLSLDLDRVNVVMDYKPALVNNQILLSMVDKYSEHFDQPVRIPMGAFPELDAVEIAELMKTGMDRLDKDIDDFVSNTPAEVLISAYKNAFISKETGTYNPTVAFLVARKFLEDTPASNVDLSALNSMATEIMATAGRRIFNDNKVSVQAAKRDRLILKRPPVGAKTGDIVVDGEVYLRWLKEGGSPEVLMGLVVSGDVTANYHTLLNDKERYLKAYSANKRLCEMRMDSERVFHTTSAVRKAIDSLIGEEAEGIVGDKDVLFRRLDTFLEEEPLSGNSCLTQYVRRVVYHVLFPHTDSLRIATEIDNICKKDDSMTAREAGTLVLVDIVTDWMCSQIKVGS